MTTTSVGPAIYFGRPWKACQTNGIQIGAPVGQLCAPCGEPIVVGDRGTFAPAVRFDRGALVEVIAPVHMECEIRAAVGSVTHLFNQAGGPWRGTYRQEAKRIMAALDEIRHRYQWEPL